MYDRVTGNQRQFIEIYSFIDSRCLKLSTERFCLKLSTERFCTLSKSKKKYYPS